MSIRKITACLLFFVIFELLIQTANAQEQKVAVIDIQKVVASSPQVKALTASKDANAKELAEFIKKAQADINKQKDDKTKQELTKKYEKQLSAKRESFAKDYSEKLKAVDKKVNEQIAQKAKEMGYTLVLPKIAVIYGGDDITEDIIKVVK